MIRTHKVLGGPRLFILFFFYMFIAAAAAAASFISSPSALSSSFKLLPPSSALSTAQLSRHLNLSPLSFVSLYNLTTSTEPSRPYSFHSSSSSSLPYLLTRRFLSSSYSSQPQHTQRQGPPLGAPPLKLGPLTLTNRFKRASHLLGASWGPPCPVGAPWGPPGPLGAPWGPSGPLGTPEGPFRGAPITNKPLGPLGATRGPLKGFRGPLLQQLYAWGSRYPGVYGFDEFNEEEGEEGEETKEKTKKANTPSALSRALATACYLMPLIDILQGFPPSPSLAFFSSRLGGLSSFVSFASSFLILKKKIFAAHPFIKHHLMTASLLSLCCFTLSNIHYKVLSFFIKPSTAEVFSFAALSFLASILAPAACSAIRGRAAALPVLSEAVALHLGPEDYKP